jgi:hypothetical protein
MSIAKKAYELLSPIPADKFLVGDFTNGSDACCSIGHYKRLTSDNPNDFSWRNCDDQNYCDLRRATTKFMMEKHAANADIADVNNDPVYNGYDEPEVKDRVLHLLKDMIEAGY